MPTDPDHQLLFDRLNRFSALVAARDMAIVDDLWNDLGFRLIGSEDGENASNPAQLTAHFRDLYAKPYRLTWDWASHSVTHSGETAWVFADGQVIHRYDDHEDRFPYRAVCIFQNCNGTWLWRLFSGSEPSA